MSRKKVFLLAIDSHLYSFEQCCESMTFWGGSGSGSADPCLWLMDPDPDPAIFLTFKMPPKNWFFNTIFSAYYFLKVHLHHFSKIKIPVVEIKDPDPDPYLWLVDPDPGGPKTCGSGGSWSGSALLRFIPISSNSSNLLQHCKGERGNLIENYENHTSFPMF